MAEIASDSLDTLYIGLPGLSAIGDGSLDVLHLGLPCAVVTAGTDTTLRPFPVEYISIDDDVIWANIAIARVESIVWGRDTAVLEPVILNLTGEWSGTGEIDGSGDEECILLETGQYMELTVPVETGVGLSVLDLNAYEAGDSATVKYKTAATSEDCIAAAWVVYTGEFNSLGWVLARVED